MGWQEPHEDQQEGVPSPASGEEKLQTPPVYAGGCPAGKQFGRGGSSVLVSMDQLCALAAKKADEAASKCCHQVQGVDPFPLLKPGEAIPGVLCLDLGFPRELWP